MILQKSFSYADLLFILEKVELFNFFGNLWYFFQDSLMNKELKKEILCNNSISFYYHFLSI